MKHRIRNTSLSRTSEHRKSLFKNLSVALFRYGYICITKAKARHFKSYIGRFVYRLLDKDRFNAYKYAAVKVNDHKSIINLVMHFYDLRIDQKRLSNYICTKKVSLKNNANSSIMMIYLIKDNII